MASIEAAQKAKADKTLNKLVRYQGSVMTKKEYLQRLKAEGLTPAIDTKSRNIYSRTKYNRMTDVREQDEYLRKCDERVTEYRAKDPAPASTYFELNKTEYEYFASLFN